MQVVICYFDQGEDGAVERGLRLQRQQRGEYPDKHDGRP